MPATFLIWNYLFLLLMRKFLMSKVLFKCHSSSQFCIWNWSYVCCIIHIKNCGWSTTLLLLHHPIKKSVVPFEEKVGCGMSLNRTRTGFVCAPWTKDLISTRVCCFCATFAILNHSSSLLSLAQDRQFLLETCM